jgi:hypothetical protein
VIGIRPCLALGPEPDIRFSWGWFCFPGGIGFPGGLFGNSGGCLFGRQFCKLRSVEDPGKTHVFGLLVILQVCGGHDAPEVLGLQLFKVLGLDKNTFQGVPGLEENFDRFTVFVYIVADKFLNLVICHICNNFSTAALQIEIKNGQNGVKIH